MNRIDVRAIGAVVGAAFLVAFVAPATVPSVGAAGTGVVDDFPLANQPRIMDGRVYSIVSSGTSVYVGGTFTTIRPASSSAAQIPQAYLFKFDVSTGVIDPTFRPVVDGEVEGLALTPDGAGLYVGGAFASINATTRTRLARLSTVDGAVDTSFTATAADRVKDLALRGNDLIVGGYFRKLNGVTRERLGALDAATGALRTAWNIPLTESRDGLGAFLQELDVSPDGEWMVVGGNFKSAGGLVRQQIAVVDLGDGTASVANWSTNRFVPQCSSSFKSTYIRGIDIAADSSWFVVNTTGAHFNGTLCDSASRWELPPTKGGPDVQPTWVTWTGTDTHWAVEVTGEAVYVGGHQRWENGPETWDGKSPGRVSRPGIAALDPTNGVPLSWNPGRDRGRGVEALLATDSYLFVGSDTTLFAGVNRQRLAVLPYAGGIQNPPPEAVELPVTLRVGMPDGTLRSLPYDGAVLGPSTTTSGPAIDGENWTTVRDAFVQRGQLTYFGSDFAYFRRAYDGVTFGPPTNLSTSLGYIATNSPTQYNQPYNVSTVRDAGFSNGWMYYTHGSDSRLWSRGYSVESGIIGGQEMVASQADWSGSRGLEVVGEWLYAPWSDGRLYRYHLDGREVELGTRTMIDDGSLTGINWSQVGAFFVTPAGGVGYPPETPVTPPPPPCGGTTPWAAQYFPSTSISGVPVTTRCETAIAYNYGSSAPSGTAVGSNYFSVRWTRQYTLANPAALLATATSIDDGIRVRVDGVRIIDAWRTSAGSRSGQTTTLGAGVHTVVVDYFEGTGNARADVVLSEVAPPPGPDVTAPDATVVAPTPGVVVPAGTVTFDGAATDDRGVTEVRVAVRDTVAKLWLQANGTWGSAYATRNATLAAPGTPSTGWTLAVTLPAGSYAVDVRARDAAANIDPTPPYISFRVA